MSSENPSAARERSFAIYVRTAAFSPEQACRQQEQVMAALRSLTRSMPAFTATLYQEIGVSGTESATPPQLELLLADAEAGRFGTLIIADADRLSRHVYRIVEIGRQLERAGVQVFVATPRAEAMLTGHLDALESLAPFEAQR